MLALVPTLVLPNIGNLIPLETTDYGVSLCHAGPNAPNARVVGIDTQQTVSNSGVLLAAQIETAVCAN
eukprot:3379542-Amphidinium_carterae.1